MRQLRLPASPAQVLKQQRPKKPMDPARVNISQNARKLAIFTKQLQVLLDSGVTLTQALNVLKGQTEDPILAEVLHGVLSNVEAGLSLSQAFSTFPRVFSRVTVGLVQAAESTGKLSDVLGKLAEMLERESNLKQRMTSAFAYPSLVIAVTAALTLFVFYAIIPNFIEIFRDQHLKLPVITQILVVLTDAVRNPAVWLMVAGIGLAAFTQGRKFAATKPGALLVNQTLQKIPLIGSIVRLAGLARFSWVMESMAGSGIPLIRCVDMASRASGSPILEMHGSLLVQEIKDGRGMADYFRKTQTVYGKLMPQMVATAEESGGFETVFGRLAVWFNQEMEGQLDLLTSTIEPVLMAVVAVIVGFILVGIFLPLYSLVGNIG